MKDVVVISIVFIVGYFFFIGLIATMIKLFFPFLTKEQLEKSRKPSSVSRSVRLIAQN